MRALLDYDSFLVIYQGFLLTGLALANLKLDSFKKWRIEKVTLPRLFYKSQMFSKHCPALAGFTIRVKMAAR